MNTDMDNQFWDIVGQDDRPPECWCGREVTGVLPPNYLIHEDADFIAVHTQRG